MKTDRTSSPLLRTRTLLMLSLSLLLVGAGCNRSKPVDRENEQPEKLVPDCSDGETSDISSSFSAGIINGKTIQYESWIEKSTVLLYSLNPEKKTSLCTATIISPTVLLTAGHCVSGTERKLQYDESTRINSAIFSANPFCQREIWSSRFVPMSGVISHPQYKFEVLKENDVALIRLDKPVPEGFEPIDVAGEEDFQNLNKQTEFIGAGYGKTLGYDIQDPYAPRLRATHMSFLELDGENFAFDQASKGLCAGDSGGPIYVRANGQKAVVAVNTAVKRTYLNQDPCKGIGYASSINFHRAFLRKAFKELAPNERNPF